MLARDEGGRGGFLRRVRERVHMLHREKPETLGDGGGVGQRRLRRRRPPDDVEPLDCPPVAEQQDGAIETGERRVHGGPCLRGGDYIAQQRVAFEERDRLHLQQRRQTRTDVAERVIVGLSVGPLQGGRTPGQQLTQQEREPGPGQGFFGEVEHESARSANSSRVRCALEIRQFRRQRGLNPSMSCRRAVEWKYSSSVSISESALRRGPRPPRSAAGSGPGSRLSARCGRCWRATRLSRAAVEWASCGA